MQGVLQCHRQRTLGKCLGLEGAGGNSGQQNQSMRAHLRIPVSLLQTERSQLSKPSWFAGMFLLLPLIFHGACLLLHLQGRGPMEPANCRAGGAEAVGSPLSWKKSGPLPQLEEASGGRIGPPNFLAGRLLDIETSNEYLGINKCTSFICSV